MKNYLKLLLFLLVPAFSYSQIPAFTYANRIGGESGGFDFGRDVVTDAAGNIFTAGYFEGKIDFDPSPATDFRNAYNEKHAFVSKFDAAGNYQWVIEVGSSWIVQAYSLILDAAGNVYVTGEFAGISDFDPSPSTATLSSTGTGSDAFIAKYDPNGNYIWAKAISGNGSEVPNSICIDGTGQINICGYFSMTADFDPSAAVATLTSNIGSNDIFMAQYDANGNYTWAKNIGGTQNDIGFSIANDAANNVFISGYFSNTVDFDPSATTYTLNASGFGQFCAKYSSAGNFVWANPVSNVGSRNAVATDASGNVVVGGSFSGFFDFDPSAAVLNLTSAGINDGYFAKYDVNGNLMWAKAIGGIANDYINNLALSNTGEVLITGKFLSTADFDPSVATATIAAGSSNSDAFLARYDQNGNYIWAINFNGVFSGLTEAWGCCFDASTNAFTTGDLIGTADFDPSASTKYMSDILGNLFLGKYDVNGNYLWANTVQETFGGVDAVLSVKTDVSGNSYATGYFMGLPDMDPSPATYTLASTGYTNDIFISKYDNSGNLVWAKSIGGYDNDRANAITTDAAGNVYLAGTYNATVDFDPSSSTFTLSSISGTQDVFFAKYDMNGNFVWAKSIGGNNFDFVNDIAIDPSTNDIVITGYFTGSPDFDPSAGTYYLTPVGTPDAYFAKYDNNGNLIWANLIGGINNDQGIAVTIQGGNIILTGLFGSTCDFDPSSATSNITAVGFLDCFVAKYNAAGNYLWAKGIGSPLSESGNAVIADLSGNIYVTGHYNSGCDFDPSASTYTLPSNGVEDIFLEKFDLNGNYIWAKGFGGIGPDQGYGLGFNASNDILVTGTFSATVDFDPSVAVATRTSSGVRDGFLAQYTTSGNFSFAYPIGSAGDDQSYCMSSASNGDILIGGYFTRPLDFDLSPSTYTLACEGNTDGFIAKYKLLCTCANINEASSDNAYFTIYPNPASETVCIKSELSIGNIKIIDLNGKIVSEKNSGLLHETISLEKINAGVYFIEVTGEKNNSLGKRKLVLVR